jgi:hypothetical protein
VKIAALFHNKPLKKVSSHILSDIDFGGEFSEGERAAISDLILKHDAFMTETFVRNAERTKNVERLPWKVIRYG